MIDQVIAAINSNTKVYQLLQTAPLKTLNTMTVEEYAPNKFQLFQGNRYDNTYILVKGRVKVYLIGHNGKSVVLDVYGPGMFLGEQEAIISKPYSASLINISPITLLKLPNREFQKWVNSDQRFADRLIFNLSDQLYHLTKRVQRYSLNSALQQVGLCLLSAHRHHQPLPRKQLTYEVDTSYRNINRVLKQLVELQAVQIKGSLVQVTNPEKLYQIIKSEG